ncbi:hypothetical protein HDU76_007052 [Blyttiomyces sp. JEL0837]|nr:hypothetical protein HDU76_007052 [Blyttiomyces sp. JEL0837]
MIGSNNNTGNNNNNPTFITVFDNSNSNNPPINPNIPINTDSNNPSNRNNLNSVRGRRRGRGPRASRGRGRASSIPASGGSQAIGRVQGRGNGRGLHGGSVPMQSSGGSGGGDIDVVQTVGAGGLMARWDTEYGIDGTSAEGMGQNGESKESCLTEILGLLEQNGITSRNRNTLRNKILKIEESFKVASDWREQTGEGIIRSGQANMAYVMGIVYSKCKHYDALFPVMSEHDSTHPAGTIAAGFASEPSQSNGGNGAGDASGGNGGEGSGGNNGGNGGEDSSGNNGGNGGELVGAGGNNGGHGSEGGAGYNGPGFGGYHGYNGGRTVARTADLHRLVGTGTTLRQQPGQGNNTVNAQVDFGHENERQQGSANLAPNETHLNGIATSTSTSSFSLLAIAAQPTISITSMTGSASTAGNSKLPHHSNGRIKKKSLFETYDETELAAVKLDEKRVKLEEDRLQMDKEKMEWERENKGVEHEKLEVELRVIKIKEEQETVAFREEKLNLLKKTVEVRAAMKENGISDDDIDRLAPLPHGDFDFM